MKTIDKITDILMLGIFITAFIANICECVATKDSDKLTIAVWIFGSMMWFILLKLEEKYSKEKIEWRDELISRLMRSRIENMNKVIAKEYVEKNYIHKDKVMEKIKEYDGLKIKDKQAYEEQIRPLKELMEGK